MLRDNGYATGMFGKWHNTPEPDISPAGPFDRWPTGLGFDYFYGFNQGETHQYYPTLYRNTTWVPQPKSPEQGYHFTADMTDEAIAWTRNVRAADPDKPWFNYFSTGRSRAAPCPQGVARQVQGQVRPRLGQAARADPRQATRNGHHPHGHEAHAAAQGDPRLG